MDEADGACRVKLSDLRTFTPLHWALIGITAVIALVAVVLVLDGFGFRFDPLNLADRRVASADRRAARAEVEAAAARSDGAARAVEAAGARQTTRQVEHAGADRAAVDRIVNRYANSTEATHETSPVADHGADLRGLYLELCDFRPAVCAGPSEPAPAGDAGDGPRRLPDPVAAR